MLTGDGARIVGDTTIATRSKTFRCPVPTGRPDVDEHTDLKEFENPMSRILPC